jgi:hypothetical protein
MRLCQTDRIPPPSEPLEFARNTKTGTVHILCSEAARRWVPSTREDIGDSETIPAALSMPFRMLCGARLLVSGLEGFPAVWTAGYSFADDDLCIGCVRGLGDQQWRAFHADDRGSPDD